MTRFPLMLFSLFLVWTLLGCKDRSPALLGSWKVTSIETDTNKLSSTHSLDVLGLAIPDAQPAFISITKDSVILLNANREPLVGSGYKAEKTDAGFTMTMNDANHTEAAISLPSSNQCIFSCEGRSFHCARE